MLDTTRVAPRLDALPAHRPFGWEPDDRAWRSRLARRLVWALSAEVGADVFVSAHLRVRLGQARVRRPLVAATRRAVDGAGRTSAPPDVVITIDGAEPVWWLARGVAQVWVVRPEGAVAVHRRDGRQTVRQVAVDHAGLGLTLDLSILRDFRCAGMGISRSPH